MNFSLIFLINNSSDSSLRAGSPLRYTRERRRAKRPGGKESGEDNVRGQLSQHIFAPNGGYCLYIHIFDSEMTSVSQLPSDLTNCYHLLLCAFMDAWLNMFAM